MVVGAADCVGVGSLIDAIEKAEKEVLVVVCTNPVPVPQKPDPVVPLLIDPEIPDCNFYQPKARRQRKQWQRPYKYHK